MTVRTQPLLLVCCVVVAHDIFCLKEAANADRVIRYVTAPQEFPDGDTHKLQVYRIREGTGSLSVLPASASISRSVRTLCIQ
jgi:hypothetical protein